MGQGAGEDMDRGMASGWAVARGSVVTKGEDGGLVGGLLNRRPFFQTCVKALVDFVAPTSCSCQRQKI